MCVSHARSPIATATKSLTASGCASVGGRPSKRNQRQHRSILAKHNYHDHSNDPAPKDADTYLASSLTSSSVAFPLKVYECLSHVEEEGVSDILSWQPHGRAFIVHKPEEFRDLVLPRFFTLKKIASFQRQLNLYGFKRLTRGADRGAYYHEVRKDSTEIFAAWLLLLNGLRSHF